MEAEAVTLGAVTLEGVTLVGILPARIPAEATRAGTSAGCTWALESTLPG